MTIQTITTIVAEDGTIHLPDGAARPGDSVIVQIERAEDQRPTSPDQDEYLTVLTADTPEKREQLMGEVLEMGRRVRAQLSEEELNFDYDAWLYDENGLPHRSSARSSDRYMKGV